MELTQIEKKMEEINHVVEMAFTFRGSRSGALDLRKVHQVDKKKRKKRKR